MKWWHKNGNSSVDSAPASPLQQLLDTERQTHHNDILHPCVESGSCTRCSDDDVSRPNFPQRHRVFVSTRDNTHASTKEVVSLILTNICLNPNPDPYIMMSCYEFCTPLKLCFDLGTKPFAHLDGCCNDKHLCFICNNYCQSRSMMNCCFFTFLYVEVPLQAFPVRWLLLLQ